MAVKLLPPRLRNLDSISESTRITIFKIVNLLIGLGSLIAHDLTILTKTKETIRYCGLNTFSGKMLSTLVSIDLTELVYLQKIDKSSPSWAFHIIPITWAFHFIPIMGISHRCPTARHKQPNNLVNRKKAYACPNSSIKATNNKIRSSIRK
jgi:hypothetical protein